MITNILTKTVTLTVKDLLIGALCGAGITAGITSIFAGKLGFKLGNRYSEKHKEDYDNKLKDATTKYDNDIKNLEESLKKLKESKDTLNKENENMKARIAKYIRDENCKKIISTSDYRVIIGKTKLSQDEKALLCKKYDEMWNHVVACDDNYVIKYTSDYARSVQSIYEEIVIAKNGDAEALSISSKLYSDELNNRKIFKEQFEAKEKERIARETKENNEREQREHEMALKKEETKKIEKYYEHIEDMKKMDIEAQKMKTAAFAGVAKSAIDTLNKEKDE